MTHCEQRELDLRPVYRPRAIAVVGASPNREVTSYILDDLESLGFAGDVYPINPKYDTILGLPAYPDLASLPSVPDVAVLCVGSATVIDLLQEVVAAGIPAVVIPAIGFGEVGGDGKARQAKLVELARAHGLLVVGPNCQGIVNYVDRSSTFIDTVPIREAGRAALLCQSGSVTSTLLHNDAGIRWAFAASTGNESVLSTADHVEYLLRQPEVDVLCAFVETIRDPDKFWRVAEWARQNGKAIVVLKAGRSDAARTMAASHSGALAPDDELADARMRQHGVVRVDTIDELLAAAALLGAGLGPKSGSLGAVVGSGGYAELLLDEVSRSRHLSFPSLPVQVIHDLVEAGVTVGEISNPIDFWVASEVEAARTAALAALAATEGIDTVLAPGYGVQGKIGIDRFESSLTLRSSLPVVHLVGDSSRFPEKQVARALRDGHAVCRGFRPTVAALDAIVESKLYARDESRHSGAREPGEAPGTTSGGLAALTWLAGLGFDVVSTHTAVTPAEAAEVAERIGLPVVLKTAGESDLHKTEHGGVLVDQWTGDMVRASAERLLSAGSAVLVQEQRRGKFELMIALRRDEHLGNFIVAGAGGIWTEQLSDVVVWPVGASDDERLAHLRRLRCWETLNGARGQLAASDLKAVLQLLAMLEDLDVAALPGFESLDLNPVMLGEGRATLVDAVLVRFEQGDMK